MIRLLFLIVSLFIGFNACAEDAVKQGFVSGSSKNATVVADAFPRNEALPDKHLSGADVASISNWPLVLLTLFGMICLIFALAWFARRFGGANFSANRDIRVISSLSVGARERVALIDVNGQQFLLGVTTQGISHLHTFEEPAVNTEKKQPKNKVTQSDFADKLQGLLKGGVFTPSSSVTTSVIKEEPDK